MTNTDTTHPECWPGTAIIKSRHNAFDWRGQGSHIVAATPSLRASATGKGHTKSPPLQIKPNAAVHGLSKKADELIAAFAARDAIEHARHGGAYSKAVPANPAKAAKQ